MERTSYPPIVIGCAFALGIYMLNVMPGIFSFLIGVALEFKLTVLAIKCQIRQL